MQHFFMSDEQREKEIQAGRFPTCKVCGTYFIEPEMSLAELWEFAEDCEFTHHNCM